MFLYDIHVHTSEVSPCGHIDALETVRVYSEARFSGICITDHYTRPIFESFHGSWAQKAKAYCKGYENARRYGDEYGLDVIFGMEVKLDGSPNEYLVYGLDTDVVNDFPELYALTLPQLHEFVQENNGLLFQAHPCRPYLTLADTDHLDGLEVFNGNPRHTSYNHKAMGIALERNLLMISGADSHESGDCGLGGMLFRRRITTPAELVAEIKERHYSIIVAPEKF